ncbi:MAG: T9SS type A sorting domain-containing protein, partial [Candidatus Zixiibacteriota bacterium]
VCEAGPVCLPIGITDEDGNLESVVVDSPFVYDDYKDRICFDADTAGIYAIQVIVADTCGLADTAAAQVTILFNSAPVITYAGPQDTVLCTVQQVCLPIGITDSENNIDTVIVTGGSYNAGDGTVCFTPSQLDATHCFTVVTLDDCGLSDSVDVCVDIIRGDTVSIQCPDTAFAQAILCTPGPVCRELVIVGDSFSVDVGVNGATWANDTVCFEADTSGIYVIPVTATARCNVDECTLTIPVEILDTVRFTLCPSNTSEFRCSADTARYLYALEGDVDSVRVNAPSVLRDDTILVPLSQDGAVPVTLIADGYCTSDTCSFTVDVDINEAPELTLGPDISLVEFDLFRICVPLNIQDQEGNFAQISSETPGVEFVDYDSLCFTPPGFDTYVIDVTVTDSCDLSSTDTIVITIDPATLFCPDGPQYADICDSGDICLFMPINPPDAGIQVTVLPSGTYDPVDRTTCVFADSGGTYEIMVIAETPNTADTCEFELRVTEAEAPTISCPTLIDTVLCVAVPETLYVPIEVSGTGIDVTVSPFGYYSAQTIVIPVPGAGTFDFDITVTGLCDDTTCSMTVVVEADEPPVFALPQGLIYEWCPGDIDTLYDTVSATDTRSDVTIDMICGPSNSDFLMIGPGVAEISFVPDTAGSYRFCFEATDGCSPAQDTLYIDVVERDDCDVCVRTWIDGGECTPVGLRKSVAVNVETNARIGGFDLLLSYDAGVMSFLTATTAGGVMTDWEYFNWNLGGVNCLPSCPSGLVRFVAYADQADGMGSPPDSAFEPNGTLFFMEFQIANDQNLGGTFPQINFVWYDCADNIFSDPTGLLAFVDTRIYSHEGLMRWDEEDEINFPESGRYPNLGTPDSCLTGETGTPNRCVEFVQGGICIIHPDSIDARGDINLNGIAYEISDVVIFTNYFIKGLSAFTINIAAQIAATDVNADGITLSVADLSYLIRVVTGDADPIPKTVPYAEQAIIETAVDHGIFSITTETVGDIGAAYLVYDLDPGIEITEPLLTSAADGLSLQWGLDEGQLRLLIFDLGTDRIAPGRNRLIEIPYSGDGSIELSHSELVDYFGKPYRSVNLGMTLPADYWLGQNYPNPFNPTTTVRFSLGKPGSWTLTVYNIAGGVVREFTGIDEGGPVEVFWDGLNRNGETIASGIYLYRLEAGEFTASRKMLLLK